MTLLPLRVILGFNFLCGAFLAIGLLSPRGQMVLFQALASLAALLLAIYLLRRIGVRDAAFAANLSLVVQVLILSSIWRVVFISLLSFPGEKAGIVYLVSLTVLLANRASISNVGFRRSGLGRNLLLGLVLGVVFYYLTQSAGLALYYLESGVLMPFTFQPQNAFLGLVFGFLMSALSEEVLFRGYVQTSMSKIVGPSNALVLTAVLFGLWHLAWLIPVTGSPLPYILGFGGNYALSTAMAGMLLGQIYRKTAHLSGPIVVHGLWNLLLSVNPPAYHLATPALTVIRVLNPILYGGIVLLLYFVTPIVAKAFGCNKRLDVPNL